jgi:hypothetical protein
MAPKEEDIETFITWTGGAADRARTIKYLDVREDPVQHMHASTN